MRIYHNFGIILFISCNLVASIHTFRFSSFSPNKDVIFELYTPESPNKPQIVQLGIASTLIQSNFNNTNPTRILIHGWYPDGKLTTTFRRAYFEKGKHEVNLISVNWLEGARTILYNVAKNRVNVIGEYVAKFIEFLVESGGMEYSDLVVIGHSLGAHIAGIAGKNLKGGRIPKIVGLDPARILFSFGNTQNRLTDTDADYVEVIHTSTLSFTEPIGTIDFYPNGGKSQPGCRWDLTARCSHQRAFELYAESIYNPEFSAFGCVESLDYYLKEEKCTKDSNIEYPLMGGETSNDRKSKGIFFLNTSDEAPFALGETCASA